MTRPVAKVEKACDQCGKISLYRPSEVKRFCSRICFFESRRGAGDPSKSITKPCEQCGALYTDLISQIGRYCSKPCTDRAKIQPVATRFWSKVGPPDANGCRDWLAGLTHDGYGKFWRNGQTIHASKAAYELVYGPVPEDKPYVCHTCNRPPCCEPTHLYADTEEGNSRYMVDQGRHGTTKLTAAEVLDMRSRRAAGERPIVLARAFSMSLPQVYAILSRKSWQHI